MFHSFRVFLACLRLTFCVGFSFSRNVMTHKPPLCFFPFRFCWSKTQPLVPSNDIKRNLIWYVNLMMISNSFLIGFYFEYIFFFSFFKYNFKNKHTLGFQSTRGLTYLILILYRANSKKYGSKSLFPGRRQRVRTWSL